ncbi:hypothetical protein OPV22_031913 [Ensete ventricosum]|uniref:Uncharacterized protein n=1 Tax=Ensete ventricosum TaxID=4639 RepID=A0AAV8PLS3_ENSVE|nr:hypothetical protein OPV22_031913 [Ensete ventricosum]
MFQPALVLTPGYFIHATRKMIWQVLLPFIHSDLQGRLQAKQTACPIVCTIIAELAASMLPSIDMGLDPIQRYVFLEQSVLLS